MLFSRKLEVQTLQEFIDANKSMESKVFAFLIKEIKTDDTFEPLFRIYVNNEYKPREIILSKDYVDGIRLENVANFINRAKKEAPEFQVAHIVSPLHPQYFNLLADKLEQLVDNPSNVINAFGTITDIDEKKVGQLTAKEQKNLFLELCYLGNDKPLNKLLNGCVLAENGTASDITVSTYRREDFDKFDITFGLERATSYGHVDVVKAILDNKNIEKLFDFSDASSELLSVLQWSIQKGRSEITSYIIDEKQYKLNKEEIYFLKQNSDDPIYADVLHSYEKKYLSSSNRPKM